MNRVSTGSSAAERDAVVMATKAIVGEKVGMTQVWDDENRVVPVTVLRVKPCRVVQVKTDERDGYTALQVTFGTKKASKISKPKLGQFEKAGVDPGPRLVELRLDDVSDYSVGQELKADLLVDGDKVDVTAVSKGKGFAGAMKRHGFRCWPSSKRVSPHLPPVAHCRGVSPFLTLWPIPAVHLLDGACRASQTARAPGHGSTRSRAGTRQGHVPAINMVEHGRDLHS